MSARHLRVDLSLLRQGVSVAFEFGAAALEELARIAEIVEHSVYEVRSLSRAANEVRFTLLNPPLRMGAFRAIRIYWNGDVVPAEGAFVQSGTEAERSLESIDQDHPITLEVGERHRFRFTPVRLADGAQRIRLEFQSVAIPPTVWFEFSDLIRRGEANS